MIRPAGRRRSKVAGVFLFSFFADTSVIAGWFELPLKLMWLSSFFLIIGGGSTVTGAVAMMVITDASPEAYR